MREVAELGLTSARHLRGEIFEVKADAEWRSVRILFAQETRFTLMSLSAFEKRTQRTPPREIEIIDERRHDRKWADWDSNPVPSD